MTLCKKCGPPLAPAQGLNLIFTPIFAHGVVVCGKPKPLNVRHILVAQLVDSKFQLIDSKAGCICVELIPSSALHLALKTLFARRKHDAESRCGGHCNTRYGRDVLIAPEPASECSRSSKYLQEGEGSCAPTIESAHQQAVSCAVASFKNRLGVTTCRIRHCLFPLGQVVPAAALVAEGLVFAVQFFPWQAFFDSCFGLGKFHYSYSGRAAAQSGALGVRQ